MDYLVPLVMLALGVTLIAVGINGTSLGFVGSIFGAGASAAGTISGISFDPNAGAGGGSGFGVQPASNVHNAGVTPAVRAA